MSFNTTKFCEEETYDDALAICSVYGMLQSEIAEKGDYTVKGIGVGVDTFFLIFSGTMVFMMQAGFAMLCAGSVRQKNVKNIMLKNLLDACGGALGFYAIGYGFAYGGDDLKEKTFIGNSYFGLRDFDAYAEFFFQFAFAATAATIVAGTVAERCKMAAYLCYSIFLTGFVYPVVVHAIWSSNGFLSAFYAHGEPFRGVGTIDFAGSGVVHMTGGATALIAAIILGPRKGRFYDDYGNPLEEPAHFPGHSTSLQILGTFILWVGWYGFNPGSALKIANEDSAQTAALCLVTTTMGAASGCVSAMFTDSIIDAMKTGETSYDLTMAMNGALAGLVAVTAGCSVITPWAAIIIGTIGGWIYIGASALLVKLRIDDAVDAIPVHFANGLWGVLAVGFFANGGLMKIAGYNEEHEGLFYEWAGDDADGDLMVAQLASIGFILGWVTVLMTPFFYMLLIAGMFRVDALEEEVGLDISHHRGGAYDITGSAKQEDVEELMETRASRHGKVEVPREVAQAADDAEA